MIFRANDRRIVCPICSVPFEDRDLIANVENALWESYLKARDDVQRQMAEEELQRRLKEEEDRRREAAGSREGRVILHRNHIIENILTLKCPKCKQAILDFEGCFAITCTCNCSFCGWCLADCGEDAHPHVRACPENPIPNGGLFGSLEEFHRNHNKRKRQSVLQYINSDEVVAEDRAYVLEAVAGDLRELEPPRLCVICLEYAPVTVACSGMDEGKHYMDEECFSANVSDQISEEKRMIFRANDRRIVCPICSVPFEDRDLIANVENALWESYLKARDDVQRQMAEEELQRRLKEEEDRRREAAGSRENRVVLHRNHIIENILTLKCPRCGRAILDFEGCFVITCTCTCNICGWCLAECGEDAFATHDHVRACPANPIPGRVDGSLEAFHYHHNQRKRQSLQQYIDSNAVAAEDRAYVLEAIKGDIRELEPLID